MLRTVHATRYVLPLREGGSLPAIVEADDLGLYVVKFRGAGQGILALIAELIAGEIGRALGLRVPEVVFIEIDPALGRNEPDYEIRQLLKSSAGLNLALDYLPGSVTFDPAARDKVSADEASLAVWFDAFTQNVDRTAKNTNLLVWHRKLYLIDHGAALYFHHNWDSMHEKIASPFADIRNHVLLHWASQIPEAAKVAHEKLTPQAIAEIVGLVPESWLEAIPGDARAEARRCAYIDFFLQRLRPRISLNRRRSMHAPASFDYAILRVVPRVERQEFMNAGILVFCLEKDYLAARIRLNVERLQALWPDADAEVVGSHLEAVQRICEGDAAAGPIAQLSSRERFHWLVSPRSTIIQTSPVHTGVCTATDDLLDRLEKQFLL